MWKYGTLSELPRFTWEGETLLPIPSPTAAKTPPCHEENDLVNQAKFLGLEHDSVS